MKRLLSYILLSVALQTSYTNAQVFERIDTLVLEETNDVMLSDPVFGDLKDDRLLVTDKQAHQVILYDSKGSLITAFGRYGQGPGDLEKPTSAIKLTNGDFLVTEFKGRISRYDEAGHFQSVRKLDIDRLNRAHLLPNGNVLLTGGMYKPEGYYLLYLLEPNSMNIIKRFFPLPFEPADYAMQPLTLAEPSFATVCGDRIVAIHAMLPLIFYYDFEGNLMNEKEIDSELFSPMEKVSNPNNPELLMKVYGDASWSRGLYCIDDEDILIQFHKNLTQRENALTVFLIDDSGDLVEEYIHTPQILFSEHGSDIIFIKDSASGFLKKSIKAKLARD